VRPLWPCDRFDTVTIRQWAERTADGATAMVDALAGKAQLAATGIPTTAQVLIMSIAQFQPGRVVNVRVNPQNPMDVAVVF
jgi:hypothetical protein